MSARARRSSRTPCAILVRRHAAAWTVPFYSQPTLGGSDIDGQRLLSGYDSIWGPLVNLSFVWGGDSHHIIGSIDPTLLGGSGRPSLY
jgi:hypothetical protein